MTHLIFIDIETTGLDPNAPGVEILELALVAVEPRTLAEVARWSTPIRSRCHIGEWPPRVVEMHTDNGLLQELRGERAVLAFDSGGLPHLHQAEAVALQFMAQFAPDQSSPMCGANVGSFDRQWLRKFMPKLDAAFHYRCLDTNFAFLVESYVFGRAQQKPVCNHRALDDARQSVQTLRTHAAHLWRAFQVEAAE